MEGLGVGIGQGYREWWKTISLSTCIMKNNCLGFILFHFVQIKLEAFKKEGSEFVSSPAKKRKTRSLDFPVDLELEHVLGSMPRKVREHTQHKNSTFYHISFSLEDQSEPVAIKPAFF